jgi:outer membrane protein assembly factor BamD
MHSKYTWLAAIVAVLILAGCAAKKTPTAKPDADKDSAEADKLLYERALKDIQHSRFETARLSLQTLINTYPDSEYLAKAKLSIADSYYKEGGTTGLTQAVAQYQDFITFFPFLDEASYAQMQIGMAHYKRMEKSDRDRTEALEAEGAFQTFVQKYQHSELEPQAEQRLREVQEILADGDFQIASFYYLRRIDKAAAPRLTDVVNRYPLYSEADRANWMLGSIYERNKHNEIASTYYARLVKEYPLSPLAADAKAKLVKFGAPVPDPDPVAMARMQKEQNTPRPRPGFLKRPGELLKGGPDVSAAARTGMPTLTPQAEDATDTLSPGAGLSVVAAGGANNSTGANGSSAGGTGVSVQVVTPGTSDPQSGASGTAANPGSTTEANGTPAAGSSAQDQAGQGGQTDSTANSGQNANGSSDASSQSSQPPTQNSNQGESSSKKKKNKKQAQLQSQ